MTENIKRLIKIARNVPRFYAFQIMLLLLAFLITLNVLIEPLFLKELIDKVIPAGNKSLLLKFVILLLGLYIIRQILDMTFYYIQTLFESKIYTSIQRELLKKAISLKYRYFLGKQKGDIITLLNEDIHVIEEFLSNSFVMAVRRMIYLLVAAGFLLYLNLKITLLALPLTLVVPILLKIYNRKITEQSAALRKSVAEIMNLIQDFVQYIFAVLALRIRNWVLKEHEERSKKYIRSNVKLYLFQAKGGILAEFLVRIVQVVIVFGLGGLDVINKKWTLGSLIAYYTYIKMLQPQVVGLFNLGLSISSISASIGKIYEFLSMPVGTNEKVKVAIDKESVLRIENVSFKTGDRYILKEMNLLIEKGEKVLLRGPTGAGKSTLIALILGVYEPSEGTVKLFGVEPSRIPDEVFQHHVGFVPQEPVLFETSLLENILVGREYSQGRIEKVLSMVRLSGLIERLPWGLDSIIGKHNIKLSGGEVQRIMLARALYSDPDFLVLDEATAHLDKNTESGILLELLKTDMTILLVSHKEDLLREFKWDKVIEIFNKAVKVV